MNKGDREEMGSEGNYVTKESLDESMQKMMTDMTAQWQNMLSTQLKAMMPVMPTCVPPVPTQEGTSRGKADVVDTGDYHEEDDMVEILAGIQNPRNQKLNLGTLIPSSANQQGATTHPLFPPPTEVPTNVVLTEEQIEKMVQKQVMAAQLKSPGISGLDLEAFVIVSGIQLPENFKAPKFVLYEGNTSPQEHIAMYYRKMAPYVQDEKMMIYFFQESLTGSALKWFSGLDKSVVQSWRSIVEAFISHYAFNEHLALTKEDLSKMERKYNESIRQFAQRWRTAADQVRPALNEAELSEEFRKTLKPELRHALAAFVDYDIYKLVKAVEGIEKETPVSRSGGAAKDRRSDPKKKDDSVNALSAPANAKPRPRNPNLAPRAPAPQQSSGFAPGPSHFNQGYQAMPFQPVQQFQIPQFQPNYQSPQHRHPAPQQYQQPPNQGMRPPYNQVPPPQAYQNNQFQPRPPIVFDPIPVPYSEIFQQLLAQGRLAPIPANPNPNTASRYYDPTKVCVFHSGQVGHDIEHCFPLKRRIQDMINAKQLNFEDVPNITNNPLPNHNGSMVGAIFLSTEDEVPMVAGISRNDQPITIYVRRSVAAPATVYVPQKPASVSEGSQGGVCAANVSVPATITRSGRVCSLPEAAGGYGLAEMFADEADDAELTSDLEDLSINAIEDDTGMASLPYPSRGKRLSNWTLEDRPERFPSK